jgi:hypothetical protein
MWETANLNVRCLSIGKAQGVKLWHPTSREKQARCGPPVVCGKEENS